MYLRVHKPTISIYVLVYEQIPSNYHLRKKKPCLSRLYPPPQPNFYKGK